MTAPLALVDTNVVVSGVLTSTKGAATAVIVDGMLSARFPFVLSEDLLVEYRAVLCRPAIRRLHGLSPGEVDTILEDIVRNGRLRDVLPVPEIRRSREDEHILRLLETAPRPILVTGDQALRRKLTSPARSCAPRDFVAMLE